MNSAGSSDEGGRGDVYPRDWRWAEAMRMARLAFESWKSPASPRGIVERAGSTDTVSSKTDFSAARSSRTF